MARTTVAGFAQQTAFVGPNNKPLRTRASLIETYYYFILVYLRLLNSRQVVYIVTCYNTPSICRRGRRVRPCSPRQARGTSCSRPPASDSDAPDQLPSRASRLYVRCPLAATLLRSHVPCLEGLPHFPRPLFIRRNNGWKSIHRGASCVPSQAHEGAPDRCVQYSQPHTPSLPTPLTGPVVPSEDSHQSEYIAPCDARRGYCPGFPALSAAVSLTSASLHQRLHGLRGLCRSNPREGGPVD